MKPRALSVHELSTIWRVLTKPLAEGETVIDPFVGIVTVAYQRQKDFTLCLIRGGDGKMWIGASRCSKKDRYSRVRGEALAFRRAVSNPPIVGGGK